MEDSKLTFWEYVIGIIVLIGLGLLFYYVYLGSGGNVDVTYEIPPDCFDDGGYVFLRC